MERATTLSEENQEGTGEGKGKKTPVRLFLTDQIRPHLPLIGFYFQNVNLSINRNRCRFSHASYKREGEVIAYGLWIRI